MGGSLRIGAPSATQAARLVDLLDGFDAESGLDGHGHEVHVSLDGQSSALLVTLFDALGHWLSDDDLGSCQIYFGERVYTLLQPSDGKPSDPTGFLLERTIQLQRALDSRVVIEQAKGMVAYMLGVDVKEAFEILRAAARRTRRTIHSVAAEVLEHRTDPTAAR